MTPTQSKEIVGLVIRDFPAELKHRILVAADRQDSSLRALAANAIAEHFDVAWRATHRRSTRTSGGTDVEIKLPRSLRRKLNQQAAAADTSARSIVLNILRTKYPAGRR